MRKTARKVGDLQFVINNDGSVNEAEYKRRLQEACRKNAEGESLKEEVLRSYIYFNYFLFYY